MWEAAPTLVSGRIPHYNILKQHEDGVFKTFATLHQHVAILDVRLVDVLRTALAQVSGHQPPPSEEGVRLLERYEALDANSKRQVSDLLRAWTGNARSTASEPTSKPGSPLKGRRKP
jgi:hypothetical protein